jgi:hypothetical protein
MDSHEDGLSGRVVDDSAPTVFKEEFLWKCEQLNYPIDDDVFELSVDGRDGKGEVGSVEGDSEHFRDDAGDVY